MAEESKFVEWTTEYVNDLPDSCFAIIMPGGEIDETGKTKPRSLRKLPYKDKDENIDLPHLRNALSRVNQPNTDLTDDQRTKAKNVLDEIKTEYLKEDTSKMGEENVGVKLAKIIESLKSKIKDKKPEESIISLGIDNITTIISELEFVLSTYNNPPDIDTYDVDEAKLKAKKEKENIEEKVENNPIEPKKEGVIIEPEKQKEEKQGNGDVVVEEIVDDEDEVKFKELFDICESYKQELSISKEASSKFGDKIKELETQNVTLGRELSKFKKETYDKLVNVTIEKVSKFQNLGSADKMKLKQHYLDSNMSESALVEIGNVTDEKIMSKLSEAKPTTIPSSYANAEHDVSISVEEKFSKMSKWEKLEALSQINARYRG